MGVLSGGVALFVGWRVEGTPPFWASALFCGVVASAICITGQMWAMQRANATRAALIFALEPVFAALFAWLWHGEVLKPSEALGGVLIVLATAVEPLKRLLPRPSGAPDRPLPSPAASPPE